MSDYIYVSYAARDRTEATAIVEVLENKGIRCWHADRISGFPSFADDRLAGIIGHAQAMVLLFSDWANKSPWIEKEVAVAVKKKLPIIILTLDDDLELNPMLKVLLNRAHWIRARTLTRIDAVLTELLSPPTADLRRLRQCFNRAAASKFFSYRTAFRKPVQSAVISRTSLPTSSPSALRTYRSPRIISRASWKRLGFSSRRGPGSTLS
jgi:TIR domain-containing protein